ncbi:Multidrug resistance protein MdtH [Kutzneria sp. CA-103260]|nr:Multidrug resistance protein MdtH [Kutzneria sp. CA-103260]
MVTEKQRVETGPRRVSVPVVLDYLLSHLGFFAVLPVLPLLVERLHPGTGPLYVGISLFLFNFAVRGASLFCSGLLHRTRIRHAMTGGLVLAAASFAALPFAPGSIGVLVCLLLAGTGISTNGLMARVYVAMALESPAARNTVFSAVQVAVNVSAALGPIVANFLLAQSLDVTLMLAVAAMYLLAAGLVAVTVPAGLRPGDHDVRPPLRLGLLKVVVTDPLVRRVSVVTAVGSFLYAQFFSAIALQVAELTGSAALRASFFTTNAILVVVVQIPVTAYAQRRLSAGATPFGFLLVGVTIFAAGFAVMGAAGATLVGAFAAVVVFSVAETFFTPTVNTAFSAIPGDRPMVELFNLRQVAATAGESLGGFAGGALFLTAAQFGARPVYWGVLAVVGLLCVLSYPRSRTTTEAAA